METSKQKSQYGNHISVSTSKARWKTKAFASGFKAFEFRNVRQLRRLKIEVPLYLFCCNSFCCSLQQVKPLKGNSPRLPACGHKCCMNTSWHAKLHLRHAALPWLGVFWWLLQNMGTATARPFQHSESGTGGPVNKAHSRHCSHLFPAIKCWRAAPWSQWHKRDP